MAKPSNKWFGVGINTYPGAPLEGCVADRAQLQSDFSQRLNAVGWQGRAAINAKARKRDIVEGLKWLGNGAISGQTLVFSASGHGTPQMRNGSLQTVFCPVDFNWSEENSLFASEVLEIIGNYPKGVLLLIIWDSCYSEWDKDDGFRKLDYATRGVDGSVPRLYPIDDQPDVQEDHEKAIVIVDRFEEVIKSGAIQCCYLPACLTKGVHSKDGETAADVRQNGKAFGAHTHYLSEIWNKVPLVTSLENVADQQRVLLDSLQYEQHCFAQGPQRTLTLKEFFGL